MNKDFDQDRPRRDGDSLRRTGRSFDRRDDGRKEETPRFNRNRTDDSANERTDKFSRRPRFGGEERPRFSRDKDDSKPRFDRDRRSDRNDGPRERSGGEFPRRNNSPGERSENDRPRFNRERSERSGGEFPRRNNRSGERSENDRPRFNRERSERSGGEFPRRNNRSDERSENDRPRFRTDRNDDRNSRFKSERSENDRPRFNRERSERSGGEFPRRNNRSDERGDKPSKNWGDKPSFKRVGGFNREDDERSRNRSNRDEERGGRRRDFGDKSSRDNVWSNEDRFSNKQRKDSGERRTGKYTKAPDYIREEARELSVLKKGRNKNQFEENGEKPSRTPAQDGLLRLNRYIANSGVCSRREADELIARGDISVNGKVVTEMGYKVKEGDTVKYGTKVLNPERFVYVLLNKPKGYITTTEDPEERKTVMELVADAGSYRMYPVGRLDRNTTGLLLLTNDGELADKLTHPSNEVHKIYQVEIDKPITEEHFEAIKKGIELEDGPIKPDDLGIVTPDAQVIGIEIHSGRNRIVRRIFEHLGYDVTKLDRTIYAGLTKKDLPRGKWRFLEPKEVVKLKYFN